MHFENGTAHEPISRAGILEASLALLKKGGSKSQKGEAFSKLLTNTGIILELSQNEDYWSLHLKVIRKNFKQAMNILSELLLEPALPPFFRSAKDASKIPARDIGSCAVPFSKCIVKSIRGSSSFFTWMRLAP